MSVYAQLADVEDQWGQPVPVEKAHDFQHLLDEAEVELEVVGGDLAARVTAALTTTARLRTAVVGMVLRVLRDEAARRELLGGTSTGEERSELRGWLQVTRRERHLMGLRWSAGSLSLSGADEALTEPLLPPTWPWGHDGCREWHHH